MSLDKKYILIVDDEIDLARSIENFLKTKNFECYIAHNGLEALELILKHPIHLILSDIRMPKMDGITLLKETRRLQKRIPLILMTGFSDILETTTAVELGADYFLAKPFRLKELLDAFAQLLEPSSERQYEVTKDLDKNFRAIKIDEFISGSKIQYPIYLRIGNDKYIKIAHTGEDLEVARIEKIRAKGIDRLYLLRPDYENFIQLTKKITQVIVNDGLNVEHDVKINFLQKANRLIADHVFKEAFDPENYKQAEFMMNTTLKVISGNEDFFSLASSLELSDSDLYIHSLGVTFFSSMLAKKLDWVSEKNVHNLTMGAFFHDIGKKMISPDILKKKAHELSASDKAILDRHPILGAELLQQIPSLPDEIIQVALQHHENMRATGYPFRKQGLKIHPFAKVISIANDFIHFATLEYKHHGEHNYEEALSKMLKYKEGYHDKAYLIHFLDLFPFGNNLRKTFGI